MNNMKLGTEREVHKRNLKAAKKAVLRCGIKIDNSPRHTPAIKIIPGNDIKIVTPMFYEIGEDLLIATYQRFNILGFCGTRILKALVDAVCELTKSESDDIRTCCWVSNYGPVDLLQFFYEWCIHQIESQKINLGSSLNKKSARNLWYSLGGYRGLKAFFADGLAATLCEFRRLRTVEEKFDVAKEIAINNPDLPEAIGARGVILESISSRKIKSVDEYVKFHPCMTCSKCKVDKYGMRTCKICYVDIPEDITVKTVNKIYPTATIHNYGNLSSEFIMHNPGDCEYQCERIGCKIKKSATNSMLMTAVKD